MCGIAGFNWPEQALISQMAGTLKHRGPDDEGFYVDSCVSLGHRRLSIIDTSEKGRQPMRYKNLLIVYNGEVYNFKELREQLKSGGYDFVSNTDTEVVLCSYHRWGPDCVHKFNGMWAFCIYDSEKKTFFLSRDRFGVKPLYYYFDGSRFIFASSLQAIRKHSLDLNISIPALNFFFYQKYIGGDLTIFKNCCKLRPSENLLFDLNRKTLTRTRYFVLEEEISRQQSTPLNDRLGSIENLLADAVEKRLVADVPVGSFLSGGVDSSLISAIISKNHEDFDTFSIGFKDESYDELKYSKIVSEYLRTDQHYDYMEVDEDVIKFVIENMDEPFGDSSVFPAYLLSKITRRQVTVALSGDAGDEVFAGYDTYKAYKIAQCVPSPVAGLSKYLINLLPPSDNKVSLTFKMQRFVRDFGADVNTRHLSWMATFTDPPRQNLLSERFVHSDALINCGSGKDLLSLQISDIHNYLPEDILKKVDFASMLNSLEVRVPYLDYRLVPLALSLPEKYKIRGLTTKWLLKKIASGHLPGRIVRRPKRGFTVPVSKWLRKSGLLREFLTDRAYYEHNLLNYDYVQKLFGEHIGQRQDNARQLWLVFVFNFWMSAQRCRSAG
jgi:asparagine synthase (glutamine-hydrolysing)